MADEPKKPEDKKINKPLSWGRPTNSGGDKGPPELDQLFRQFFGGKKSGSKPPLFTKPKPIRLGNKHNWKMLAALPPVAILAWIGMGFYVVQPAERGVVLRFGQYVETVLPGPHWYPRFIEQVDTVNVEQVNSVSIQQSMLTSEANLINVQFAIQYRISDPTAYLFNTIAPEKTLKQISESAIRQVVGTSTLEQVLTDGKDAVADKVQQQIDQLVSQYQLGLEVTAVTMQPAKPPEQVQAAFDDVNKAQEEHQRMINMAQTYANSVVPVAKGQAARLIQQAQAYQQKVVLEAQGDVAGWQALLPVYQQFPQVTKTRMYFDTMERVLKHAKVAVIEGDKPVVYLPFATPSVPAAQVASPSEASAPAPASSATAVSPQALDATMKQVEFARWGVAND